MLFANNCNTTLNGGITAIATSMVVTSATGFPAPTGSQYFYCTLADAATQTTIEIVKVTAVSGTTFTIVRGQDGTTGTIFASGAVVSLRLVAASLNDFPKLDETNSFTADQTINTLTMGLGAGSVSTNTAVGASALPANTTGATNTAIGYQSLQTATTASNNTALGYQALNKTLSGGGNTGIGGGALYTNTGTDNTALGYLALTTNTANRNTAVGAYAGRNNSTGTITAIGWNVLGANTTGTRNVAIGGNDSILNAAMQANTTGANNNAIGVAALTSNVNGSNNVAMGTNSLGTNTIGTSNTAIGYTALYNTTSTVATLGAITGGTGYNGGASGGPFTVQSSLSSGTAAIGLYPTLSITVVSGVITAATLVTNGTGFVDTTTVLTVTSAAMVTGGFAAGGSGFSIPVATLASGASSVGIGYQAGYANTNGSNIVALGYQAGYGNASANANTTGSNNTYIGYRAVGSAATNTNEMVIGYTAVGLGSNSTVIGNSSTTQTKVFGSLTSTGVMFPQQATTAAAPAYVKGAIYFDTTLNKLRVGGATAWETITSV